MTHLSLFSGIGGLDLAAEWAGFETIGQCEWADYPTRVLEKHWPDVPRWRDIRTLTKESFFEKTGLRTVDVISGGFPCQPFSVAGKQEGKGDDRYLWPEMRRVISELTPRWVVGENVPGILRIAAVDVVQDLERLGFDVVVFDFEAASVGASHRRERIAFVAHSNSRAMRDDGDNEWAPDREKHTPVDTGNACGKAIPDSTSGGVSREQPVWVKAWRSCGAHRWDAEPGVGRVAHGVPARMDRLKCLGNAVVPKQFFPIFNAIHEIEKEDTNEHQND